MTPFSESATTDPISTVKATDPNQTGLTNIDSLLVERRGARLFLQSLSEDMVQAFLQDPVASLRSWGQAPAPGLNNINHLNQSNIGGEIFTRVNLMETASSPELDPNNQSKLSG